MTRKRTGARGAAGPHLRCESQVTHFPRRTLVDGRFALSAATG